MLIKNSVFLVTGGASNDYGRATVETLLREGGRVIICDLPTRDLHIFGDDKAIFLPINVHADKDIKTLLAVIEEKYGRLDGVINCIDSCISMSAMDFKHKEPHGLKEFAEIIYDNILGPFNIIRFTIPLLAKNIPKKGSGRGIIINMSSAMALGGDKGFCAYAASKGCLIKMTESLNFELQGIQIRCVAIVTGPITPQFNKTSSFIDNIAGMPKSAEGPRKFAELVSTIIQTSSMNPSMILLENVSTI